MRGAGIPPIVRDGVASLLVVPQPSLCLPRGASFLFSLPADRGQRDPEVVLHPAGGLGRAGATQRLDRRLHEPPQTDHFSAQGH